MQVSHSDRLRVYNIYTNMYCNLHKKITIFSKPSLRPRLHHWKSVRLASIQAFSNGAYQNRMAAHHWKVITLPSEILRKQCGLKLAVYQPIYRNSRSKICKRIMNILFEYFHEMKLVLANH